MNKKLLLSIAYAIVFVFLFYEKDLGLNVWIFEGLLMITLIATKQFVIKNSIALVTACCYFITVFFTVINYSFFGYTIHFIVCIIATGWLIYPNARSLTATLLLGINNLFSSQKQFLLSLTSTGHKGNLIRRYFLKTGIFIIPCCVIIVFFAMYQSANPHFERFFNLPLNYVQKFLRVFFEQFNFLMLFCFLLGLLVCNAVFFRKGHQQIIHEDGTASDNLERKRKKQMKGSSTLGLKNEYKAAIFLFICLNALLFILNIFDVYAVWFRFEWQGQYLKQYVHAGTYLLILSIIISILIVLYYFRGNMNFYPGQKLLRMLAFIWIAQNILLVISVGIRNFWYIHYFALAYKRIGVYIFLLLTVVGLITVFIKVKNKKTIFFLLRTNAIVWLVVLTGCSIINWETVIAQYNFSKYQKSFIDIRFLASFPDKSLPYLDKPYEEMVAIDKVQKKLFHFDEEFMTPLEYYNSIQQKKTAFRKKWQNKNWLEWNYAEWKAYQHVGRNR